MRRSPAGLRGRGAVAAGRRRRRAVFHAGTRRTAGGYESTGGRVVTLVGRGATLADARAAAYRGVDEVRLEGARFRTDIGELHVDDRKELRDEAG